MTAEKLLLRQMLHDWLVQYARLQQLDPELLTNLGKRDDEFVQIPFPTTLLHHLAQPSADLSGELSKQLMSLIESLEAQSNTTPRSVSQKKPSSALQKAPAIDSDQSYSDPTTREIRTRIRALLDIIEAPDKTDADAALFITKTVHVGEQQKEAIDRTELLNRLDTLLGGRRLLIQHLEVYEQSSERCRAGAVLLVEKPLNELVPGTPTTQNIHISLDLVRKNENSWQIAGAHSI